MSIMLVEKVRYRIPGTSRLIWAIVLAQREGLSLLFVRSPDDVPGAAHPLAIATENNTRERVYEDVKTSCFPLERKDVLAVSIKMQGIADLLCEGEVKNMLEDLI